VEIGVRRAWNSQVFFRLHNTSAISSSLLAQLLSDYS